MPTICWPSTKPSRSWPRQDPVAARLVKLRYFAGLSLEAGRRGPRHRPPTAYRIWAYARAWLRAGDRRRASDRHSSPSPAAEFGEDFLQCGLRVYALRSWRASGIVPRGQAMNEREIFLECPREAVPGGTRRLTWTSACGRRRCASPARRGPAREHAELGSFLEAPPAAVASGASPTIDQPPTERPGTVDRPLQAEGADRRGGHGRRLRRRAIAARAPQGRPEGHQAGDGHASRSSPASRPSARPWR